jgi:hypothetical protein
MTPMVGRRSAREELTEWTLDADKVLVFQDGAPPPS